MGPGATSKPRVKRRRRIYPGLLTGLLWGVQLLGIGLFRAADANHGRVMAWRGGGVASESRFEAEVKRSLGGGSEVLAPSLVTGHQRSAPGSQKHTPVFCAAPIPGCIIRDSARCLPKTTD